MHALMAEPKLREVGGADVLCGGRNHMDNVNHGNGMHLELRLAESERRLGHQEREAAKAAAAAQDEQRRALMAVAEADELQLELEKERRAAEARAATCAVNMKESHDRISSLDAETKMLKQELQEAQERVEAAEHAASENGIQTLRRRADAAESRSAELTDLLLAARAESRRLRVSSVRIAEASHTRDVTAEASGQPQARFLQEIPGRDHLDAEVVALRRERDEVAKQAAEAEKKVTNLTWHIEEQQCMLAELRSDLAASNAAKAQADERAARAEEVLVRYRARIAAAWRGEGGRTLDIDFMPDVDHLLTSTEKKKPPPVETEVPPPAFKETSRGIHVSSLALTERPLTARSARPTSAKTATVQPRPASAHPGRTRGLHNQSTDEGSRSQGHHLESTSVLEDHQNNDEPDLDPSEHKTSKEITGPLSAGNSLTDWENSTYWSKKEPYQILREMRGRLVDERRQRDQRLLDVVTPHMEPLPSRPTTPKRTNSKPISVRCQSAGVRRSVVSDGRHSARASLNRPITRPASAAASCGRNAASSCQKNRPCYVLVDNIKSLRKERFGN